MKIKIGIQGSRGSTNERAAHFFAEKYGWGEIEIHYLLTTENVLSAVEKGSVDYGTFAWESRSGLVEESAIAVKNHKFKKIDEHAFQLDHALLSNGEINKEETVKIHSHPQALKEHKSFLLTEFPKCELIEDIDTATAAESLAKGEYGKNSLALAPLPCAKLYGLSVYNNNLPTNDGYLTTIFLARK